MKWLVIFVYGISVLHVHWRGRARLPWRRELLAQATFMAPVNVFIHLFSKAPSTAFVPVGELPELAPLQRNWEAIRDEAEGLLALRQAGARSEDANFDAFLKNGLKDFYLKWYDVAHSSAQRLCPRTFALLQGIPAVKIATFAQLPAGGVIAPHRDPFAGWVRYHLGLDTPGSDGCFIEVDGQRHSWCNGQAMIFDETYVHWAANESGRRRLILLCDIERPMRFRWAQAFSRLLGRTLMTITIPPHDAHAQRGLGGALARVALVLARQRRRLKAWNRSAYRATLAGAALALAALAFYLL